MFKAAPLVLLVDDDAAITTVLGSLLKQEGMAVTCAASASDALASLTKHPIDFIPNHLSNFLGFD